MKKPKKPTKPKAPEVGQAKKYFFDMYGLNQPSSLEDVQSIIFNLKEKVSNILSTRLFDLETTNILIRLFKDIKTLQKHEEKIVDFNRKMNEYRNSLQKYDINFNVWRAWDLKKREEQLSSKIKRNQSTLDKLKKDLKEINEEKRQLLEQEKSNVG